MDFRFWDRQTTAEKLTELGIVTTTSGLAQDASEGRGPPYVLIRGRALYRPEEVERWISELAAGRGTPCRRGRRSAA